VNAVRRGKKKRLATIGELLTRGKNTFPKRSQMNMKKKDRTWGKFNCDRLQSRRKGRHHHVKKGETFEIPNEEGDLGMRKKQNGRKSSGSERKRKVPLQSGGQKGGEGGRPFAFRMICPGKKGGMEPPEKKSLVPSGKKKKLVSVSKRKKKVKGKVRTQEGNAVPGRCFNAGAKGDVGTRRKGSEEPR